MNKAKTDSMTYISITAAGTTVFFSSACIMLIELSAGRLAARDIGSSLYTWTAVIGVVLAGMTAGSYIGGRIADRFAGKRIIAGLFGIASITCVGAIVLHNRIGTWGFLWRLSWQAYVLTYIAVTFLLPAVFLGAIAPVAIKAALDRQIFKGKAIGSIYAFGAAGSIVGTFLAGFWLIPAIGPTGVIWATAAAILIAGLTYGPRDRLLHIWAAAMVLLVFLGTAHVQWAEETGAILTLRSKPDKNTIYEKETQYCYINIKQDTENPDKRSFNQDKLKHGEIVMGDINNLQYAYERIYAAVTEQISRDKNSAAVLAIGGGGFVLPRYLKHRWPAIRIDVAEIDPGVTEAAIAAFGLPKNHGINIFSMDGRNFIDNMIEKKQSGLNVPRYDCIYGDAFDNFSVPYQLLTREFNEKIARILNEDGFYMLNLIDIYESGLILGSVLNTLQQTFTNVSVLSPHMERYNRDTFVLIASQRKIDTDPLVAEIGKYYREVWLLNPTEIENVIVKCGRMVLTDDYAPTDNLTAPIARQDALFQAANMHIENAKRLMKLGDRDEFISECFKAIRVNPALSIPTYCEIAKSLMLAGEFEEAIEVCKSALNYYDRPGNKKDISPIHLCMGTALKNRGQNDNAREHFRKVIEENTRRIEEGDESAEIVSELGMAFMGTGDFTKAAGYFEQAVKTEPSKPLYRTMLAEVLIEQKDYAGAQGVIDEAIDYMKRAGNEEAVSGLQRLLNRVKYERSQPRR